MGVNLFGEIRGQNPRLLIKRISHMLPFLLAILTFIFLVWSGYYVLNFPYDGFFVNSRTGIISSVDQYGPVSGKLFAGDRISPIIQKYYRNGYSNFQDKSVSDIIILLVVRDDVTIPVMFELSTPPLREIINRLIPLLVSLIFILAGIIVLALRQEDKTVNLFFYTTQVGGFALIIGNLRLFGFTAFQNIFFISILLVGPLTIHFHARFFNLVKFKLVHSVISLLYGIAIISSLIFFIRIQNNLNQNPSYYSLGYFVELFLLFNFIIIGVILVFKYFRTKEQTSNGMIRLITFGGLLDLFLYLYFLSCRVFS